VARFNRFHGDFPYSAFVPCHIRHGKQDYWEKGFKADKYPKKY